LLQLNDECKYDEQCGKLGDREMYCLYSDIISPCSESNAGTTKFDMYAMFRFDFLK